MSRATRYVTGAGLVGGVLLLAAGVVLLITPAPEMRDEALWGALFTQGIWILLALLGAALSRSRSLGERLGLGRGALSIPTSAVLVVGFVALSGGLHQWLVSAELRYTGSLGEIDAMVREARTRAPSFLLALLALGIAPGFGEEFFFRGFVQRGLTPRLGTRWGVLLAAALFGLAHLDPVQSSLAFVLGAYLGVVTQLAGCIRTAILCHLLNNTLGLLAPALIPDALAVGGPWAIPLLLALAAASLLYAGWRRSWAGPEPPPGELPTLQRDKRTTD
jgi:membrane protease YdiL (CAAX protease family)